MEYLTLNNGVQMPLVSFGTFMLGGDICRNAVAAAIENGYRMIDTVEAYGNKKEVGEGICKLLCGVACPGKAVCRRKGSGNRRF